MAVAEDMTAQQVAEACAEAMWRTDHASQELGMEIVSIAPGEATITMPVSKPMINGHGIAHGGYIFTLADSTFAYACNTYNLVTVAQHCSITYITPGALGDLLTATAIERSRQGRSGIYDITVTREDGTMIAEFRGHSRSIKQSLLNGEDG